MKHKPRYSVSEYPETYEINEITKQDHFYLHFGFYDDRKVWGARSESRLAKYHQQEIDTSLLSRKV